MAGGGGGSSKPQRPEETAAERALAETSARKWSDYQQYSVPLENQFMRSVDRLGTEGAQRGYGLRAEANAMQQTQGLQGELNAGLMARGADPSSNSFKTKSMALNNAIKKTQANAQNAGRMAGENAYLQGLGNVVALGNGQETAAFNGMGNLAQRAASESMAQSGRDFERTMTNRANNQQLAGQVMGMGLSTGMNYMGGLSQTSNNYGTNMLSQQNRVLNQQDAAFR